jgi:hypothetical protein
MRDFSGIRRSGRPKVKEMGLAVALMPEFPGITSRMASELTDVKSYACIFRHKSATG